MVAKRASNRISTQNSNLLELNSAMIKCVKIGRLRIDLVSETHPFICLRSYYSFRAELQHKAKFSNFLNKLKYEDRPPYCFVGH